MTDFLMVPDLGETGLIEVLETAASVKADPDASRGRLAGMNVGLFFEKPSTRTRVSAEVACVDLGAHPVVLKQDEVGLGKREAVADVARVLDRYLDVLAFRVFRHADLEAVARHADAPVINLLSDRSHPCQGIADLQTIAENRPLPGTTVTYVGDGNNVAHSLLLGGAMVGMHVRVASPDGYDPDQEIVGEAARIAAATGGSITVGPDVVSLVSGADVVYTDVWASMGQEAEAQRRAERFAPYRVDDALFAEAADDAIFLHCLPAHRGEEVTDGVVDHERSRVFDQAENRMHSFKALLLYLAG
jgi:ornithine carbamoyltransferase